MKNFKKLFAVILCCALIFATLPLTAFAENEVVVPEVDTNYNVIDSRSGINAARYEVKAGAQLFNSTNGSFEAMDASQAEYVEFDVYVTAQTTNYFWFWMVSNEDYASVTDNDNFNGGAWKVAAGLDAGWNHVVIDITSCSRTRGDYNKSTFTDFRAIALEGVPVTASVYDIIVANVSLTTSGKVPITAPEMKNNYNEIDSRAGINVSRYEIKAGASLFNGTNGLFKAMDASKAEYVEFDIYVTAPTTNYIWFWMLSNENVAEITNNDDFNGGAWKIAAGLDAGWNHVVIDITSCSRTRGDYDKATFTDFRAIALEGVPVTSEVYDIVVANVALTTAVEPPPKFESENIVIDVAKEMHVNAPKLKAGAILWNYYNDTFEAMDASKADYLEVDIYVSAPTENYMWFWMTSNENIKEITNNDDINGGAWKIPAGLDVGWNHVVIDITSCTRARGDYNKETFNNFCSIALEGVPISSTSYDLKVANVALTRVAPEMVTDNNLWFAKEGVVASRNAVKPGASLFNSTYGTFTAMDASEAEYVEFDIYVTTPTTNYIWFWMLSNENVGEITSNDDFNGGAWKIPAGLKSGWNHVVIDITSCSRARGDYNKETFTDFCAIALEGVPVAASGVTYDIKVANVALTSSEVYNPITYLVEVDGVKYETLEDAVAIGGNIKLLADVTLEERLVITNDVTLDLNGYTLTTFADNANYDVVIGANVVITGNGTVVTTGVYGIGVQAAGNLTIENGTFKDAGVTDYLIGSWGTVVINGGTFNAWYCALNGFDGTITVNNATVVSDHPAEGEWPYEGIAGNVITLNGSYDIDVTDFCAEGYVAAPNGEGAYIIVEAFVVGDVTGDEAVDMLDLIALKNVVLEGTYNYVADFDANGSVNAADLAKVRKELFAKF